MSPVVEPNIVLAAYAEPIASGRRVLVVGPALSALPERLIERGARIVHVCDPDPVRLAEATAKNRSASISFSALADGHFALRDGAFDVCIVEDAGIADTLTLVRQVRRSLSPRGVALFASLNADAKIPLMPHRPAGMIALDYYALYDAVRAEFEQVRMLGQAPFVGYVVADFAPEGTPEPSLDTAFVPGGAEEPELFIAVASQHPVSLEAFAVIQLPFRSVVGSGAVDADALRKARATEVGSREKLREAEAERAEARAQGDALREALRRAEAEQTRLSKSLTEQEAKLQLERDGKLRAEREAKALAERDAKSLADAKALAERDAKSLAERDAKLRQSEASAARLRELEGNDAKLREAETRVFARDAELAALRQELSHKNQQLRDQTASLKTLSDRLAEGPSSEEAVESARELSALEQALQERGEAVRRLERELREAARIGKELLREVRQAGPESSAATTVPKDKDAGAESLAQQLAKSQADLIATRWALEAAVRQGKGATTPEA